MSDEMTASKLREQKEEFFNSPRFQETKRLQEEVFQAFLGPITKRVTALIQSQPKTDDE